MSALVRVPFLRPLGVALVVAGLIGLGIGVLVTHFGVRSRPIRTGLPASSSNETAIDVTVD